MKKIVTFEDLHEDQKRQSSHASQFHFELIEIFHCFCFIFDAMRITLREKLWLSLVSEHPGTCVMGISVSKSRNEQMLSIIKNTYDQATSKAYKATLKRRHASVRFVKRFGPEAQDEDKTQQAPLRLLQSQV